MTTTSLEQFVDINPDGSFDHTPPCESERCEQPAVWILWRVPCCPDTPLFVLVCDTCRAAIWDAYYGRCGYCGIAEFVPARTAFYRAEPINHAP